MHQHLLPAGALPWRSPLLARVYTCGSSHSRRSSDVAPRPQLWVPAVRLIATHRVDEVKDGEPLSAAITTTVELIHRIQGGEAAASERLAGRFIGALTRWASGRLPARARRMIDTEDLVQDALMRTMARLDDLRLDNPGAMQSYLRQAIINRIRDEIRRTDARPLDDRSLPAVQSPDPSPLELAIGEQTLADYEAALARLKPTERDAFLARVELGLAYDEIATVLGKPTADSARMSVRRAVLRLAELLDHGE